MINKISEYDNNIIVPNTGNITPCTSSWLFCAVLMYFQLGCDIDFRVWHNNDGILATNVNLVMAPHSGTITT